MKYDKSDAVFVLTLACIVLFAIPFGLWLLHQMGEAGSNCELRGGTLVSSAGGGYICAKELK